MHYFNFEKIYQSGFNLLKSISQKTKCRITSLAEQSANFVCLMIVINIQPLTIIDFVANCTHTVLFYF